MSSRLDQERENRLQPRRIQKTLFELSNRGIPVHYTDKTKIKFMHKGYEITYHPYSGWASGKSIEDGRGLNNLLNQIDEEQ